VDFPWFLLIIACLLLAWLFYWLTARQLRRSLPEPWRDLGEPSGAPIVGTLAQLDAGVRLAWFLFSARRENQNDGVLWRRVWAYRLVALSLVLLLLFTPR
jgi:hypothetical protein